ncbi:hypothetical protein Sjap_020806 [Stephania japonica]|uniref:LOB domain-containing protein n=1 Tax=Stephania japonica TaxID=461633 RepID=A0AAP0F452_9MAGN
MRRNMSSNSTNASTTVTNNNNSSSGGNSGPCGACKFLRRKCVKGCIFAPYFDSEQGSTHFAAVHKVFGASNVSKLLLRIPPHKRLDAVVTICYEALARVRDPVYGCVAHIFALQQQLPNCLVPLLPPGSVTASITGSVSTCSMYSEQAWTWLGHGPAMTKVVNLQSELAFVQAHLSTLELSSQATFPAESPELAALISSSNMESNISGVATHLIPLHSQHTALDATSNCGTQAHQHNDIGDTDDLQFVMARDFVSKYLASGARFKSSIG